MLDTGSVATGKIQNKIDNYRCPRCAGAMSKLSDPDQPHIWLEQCDACQGSFLDAGKLRDLATVTASDFFKRIFTGKRL